MYAPPGLADFRKSGSTYWKDVSLETKLSDRKNPLGSDIVVTSCQKALSLSLVGMSRFCAGAAVASDSVAKARSRNLRVQRARLSTIIGHLCVNTNLQRDARHRNRSR